MSVSVPGLALAVLATVALAVQSLAVRKATRSTSMGALIGVIFAVNLIVFVPVAIWRYAPAFGLTPVAVGAFVVGGLLGSLLARYALFVGIERLGASRADPLKSTFPLVAVAGAVLFLDEQLTLPLVAGVVLLVGGAAAVSWDARTSPATAAGPRAWLDLRYPLLAALLLGIDPVFAKIGLAEGTPALVGVTVRVTGAAVAFGLSWLWWREADGGVRPFRPGRWTLLAAAANTTYLGTYLAALEQTSVSVVAPILGASPLLVVLGSAVFLRGEERVTVRLGLGVLVLVAGVVLVLGA